MNINMAIVIKMEKACHILGQHQQSEYFFAMNIVLLNQFDRILMLNAICYPAMSG